MIFKVRGKSFAFYFAFKPRLFLFSIDYLRRFEVLYEKNLEKHE
ncbi:hypothetical protein SD78_1407 [Bacillus badius]|nr:hypothetical protein SD78_1407 [Bacillus badius]